MSNPTAAILIIGDEILSGRTREGNAYFLSQELTKAGIDLREIRVVSDDQAQIIDAVRALSEQYDTVFTSGGIGPTHDDITADAVGAAFGAKVDIRDDARALLEAHYASRGTTATPARLRMARIPDGARLIDNPVSVAPGFNIGNVYVMAGVPNVFQAMVASVLPTLTGGAPVLSRSLRVPRPESEISEPLRDAAQEYSDLSFGSYPFVADGAYGVNLVVRGQDEPRLEAGFAKLKSLFPEGE
ncbi:molybdopterin-binding protein [Thioclava sp. SK-1]|uniref:competence/damage-inducible protein A n=1 Tax=Thioclava sp. SK-1 TaxID=1889770 RepID=UPI000824B82F|nr:competence/damage-inducible protein A [Thioclava sp. SK-1]OCX65840.1 molybdopterin-binding protein [Thioclava sp. SK-1]